jgi:hypothetical protein
VFLNGDPIGAAWRWLQAELEGEQVPRLLVLIGLGDGALLDALDHHAPTTRVLALEPDPVQGAAFLASGRGNSWRASGRLVYLCAPDFVGADDAWRIFPTGIVSPPVLVFRADVATENAVRALRLLKQILFGVKANDQARRQFAPRYLVNTIRNVPAMLAGADVRGLTGAFPGIPAVICGAGPSLDTALGDLRASADRALLITTDTALRPLLTSGLAPHLVVAVDPSHHNARHFLGLPACPDTWLVAESAIDAQVPPVFSGRTFWFHVSNHHPWPWLNANGVDVGGLKAWGSVLTSAFELACLAGCDPIVFVGADLAFTGDRPYARGTTYEFDWAISTADGRPLEEAWRRQMAAGEILRMPDVRGVETATTPVLLSFRDWMLANAGRSGRRVINATGAGMLFGAGLEQASGLTQVLTREISIPSLAAYARSSSTAPASALAAGLRAVAGTPKTDVPTESVLASWAEFSGDAFERATLDEVLCQAAGSLTSTAGARDETNDWWRPLATHEDVSRTIACVPEGTARFRAALHGVKLSLDGGRGAESVDTGAVLRAARELLGWIRDTALQADCDVAAETAWNDSRIPISARYAWPQTTRWAIHMYEALLGRAWTASPITQLPAFFARPVPFREAAAPTTTGGLHTEGHANATSACVQLAFHWLRSQAAFESVEGPALQRMLLEMLAQDARDQRDQQGERALARLLTGRLHTGAIAAPRILTDEALRGHLALVAYSTADGPVCVPTHSRQSIIVREDGSSRPHRVWPRPIVDELPFGDDGAVAWGAPPPRPGDLPEPAYVMYRRHADDEVHIEDLSIRPVTGCWYGGRLYWSCYSLLETWVGLASWAPGEAVRLEIPDLTLFAMQPDESGLRLQPCVYRTGAGNIRKRLADAWLWLIDGPPTRVASGPYGVASSQGACEGWTAIAHPEADLVRFETVDGRAVSMTCFYPLRVAWTGRSLLVSTVQRDLLLFEDMIEHLESASEAVRTTR